MNLSTFTQKSAHTIAEKLDLQETQGRILAYGLEVALSFLCGAAAVFIIAMLLGVLYPTFIVVVVATFFRSFTGGAHCTSSLRCNVVSAVVFPLLGLLAAKLTLWFGAPGNLLILSGLLFTLLLTYLYAPGRVPQKPISEKQQKKLRARTMLLIPFWIVLLFYGSNRTSAPLWVWPIFLGGVWQFSTLHPLVAKIFSYIDVFLQQAETSVSGRRCN